MGGLERLARSAAAAGILAGAFGVVRPAAADTLGGCNTDEGCRPDNLSPAWCYGNGFTSTALRTAATYALGTHAPQTNFTPNSTPTSTTTTDVIIIHISNTPGPRSNSHRLPLHRRNK